MAIKAMVFRLQQLHRIDMDHSRSLYKQISARGWNKNEPMEVGNEGAIWLAKALSQRFPGDDPLAQAADRTGIHRPYFDSWTSWEPNVEAKVIQLHRRTNSIHGHGSGRVTRL